MIGQIRIIIGQCKNNKNSKGRKCNHGLTYMLSKEELIKIIQDEKEFYELEKNESEKV